MQNIFHSTLFKAGVVIQFISTLLLALMVMAIRLEWIDLVAIGLEGGIDKSSPKLSALYRSVYILIAMLVSGFVLYAFAFMNNRKKEPTIRCAKSRSQ